MHWWLGIKNVYNSGSNVMRCWGFRMSNYSWKAEGQLVSENNKSIFIVMKIHSPQTFWELNRIPLLQRAWWLRTDGNPSPEAPEALGSSLSQFSKTSLSGPRLPTDCGGWQNTVCPQHVVLPAGAWGTAEPTTAALLVFLISSNA